MYVPLKIITDYTLLKSMIKIDDLITFLKEKNINTCAITDENLFGSIEFFKKCRKNNIKPIIGLTTILENLPIYLYAKNYQGYQHLLLISQKEEINYETLEKYKNNILIIIPSLSYNLFNKLSENCFLGYSNEIEKEEALKISQNIVYVNDIRALTKEDTKYLNYLEMISLDVKSKDYEKFDYSEFYLKENISEEDTKTTINFSNLCNIKIPFNDNHIPIYKENENSNEFLKNLSFKGLNKRLNGINNEDYNKRLNYELNVIEKLGFSDYILIVYDYVLYAKKNNIFVGPGRGSAAGSLVCYTLGITDIDPLKYNLLFERFLNPERITMPDIDIDFESRKRDDVILYIKNKYGSKNVANIIAFSTLKSKLVLKDISRILEINTKEFNDLLSLVSSKFTLKENLKDEKIKNILDKNDKLKSIYKLALKLEGIKKNHTKHAAGVVICNEPLENLIPVLNNDNLLTTGLSKDYLEDLGLLKMDLLAIENLTMISNVLELIYQDKQVKIDLNKVNLNDKEVLNIFSLGNTEGVFQFESVGMKSFLTKLKPRNFLDLVAAIALYRPGPMDNINTFIKRKENKEKVTYIHPSLESILKETEGIIVYQEQVMQILVTVANYTFAEADLIRRAMSKKNKETILNEKEKFIKRAISNNYNEQTSEELFNLILKFADYGFNKSHSVAYALIGYWMAYLKVKTPKYFLINLLNMNINSVDKTKEYLNLAKQYKLKLIHPNINTSLDTYYVKNNELYLPLTIIKGINQNTITNILKERSKEEFKDYIDFVRRNIDNINSRVLETLIDANTLRDFGNITTLKDNTETVLEFAKLSFGIDDSLLLKPLIKEKEEKSDILELEFKSYGFYITNHPTSIYNNANIMKLENIKNNFNKYVRVIVLIENIKETKTKKGDSMAFIEASDETGNCSFVIFSKQMLLLKNINKKDIVEIQGRVEKRFDTYQINVNNMIKKEG